MEPEAIIQTAKALGLPVQAAYTVKHAAKILGIGHCTLYRSIRLGKVKVVKVGKYLYMPITEMARILAGEVKLEPPRYP